MTLALTEIRRVCADGARILLVLGRESNVQKTPFYNGAILERLAVDLVGLRLDQKQERVFVNRFGQNIYEDLLHLTPQQGRFLEREPMIASARRIGAETLSSAAERAPHDRRQDLDDAIAQADQIEASPLLDPIAALEGVS